MDKKTAAIFIIGGGILALASGAAATVVTRKRSFNTNVTQWDEYIYVASQSAQIAPAIIATVIEVESGGRANSTGTVGEIGLMQIKCDTAKQMGYSGDCQKLYDPDLNILFGAKYLAWQSRRYGGNLRRIFSAYNAGTATSANPAYVDKAMSVYQRYINYYG